MTDQLDKKAPPSGLRQTAISFGSGALFGLASVVVGQPLDTIKTRMQAHPKNSKATTWHAASSLFRTQGIRGLYRGGMPLFVGGAMFRSAQFGCYDLTMAKLEQTFGKPQERLFGIFDLHVIAAGVVGGLGRGVVEAPFEFVKVRRQVERQWSYRDIYRGSGVTILRNAFLFGSFVIYIDQSKRLVSGGLSPFWTGALCATAAWLTIWPLDVIKSQSQSGHYTGMGSWQLLCEAQRTGKLYRGLVPGLLRSSIANGVSMTVYTYSKDWLTAELL